MAMLPTVSAYEQFTHLLSGQKLALTMLSALILMSLYELLAHPLSFQNMALVIPSIALLPESNSCGDIAILPTISPH